MLQTLNQVPLTPLSASSFLNDAANKAPVQSPIQVGGVARLQLVFLESSD